MLAEKNKYFIIDGVLCVKEVGTFRKIIEAHYRSETTKKTVIAYPLFAEAHLIMINSKGRTPVDSIFAVKKIPQTGKFPELPLPLKGDYKVAKLKTAPYVLIPKGSA